MLKGNRVTLRAVRREEMELYWKGSQDVEYELLGGGDPPRPLTLEGWQKWFDEKIAARQDESDEFGIEADDKLIGSIGLRNYHREARTCDFGIGIFDRNYWSKGYGREAIDLILGYAFRLRNLQRVHLTTSSNNERAIRCYLACGFVEEGRLRRQIWCNGEYVDEVHMGILVEEWVAKQQG